MLLISKDIKTFLVVIGKYKSI